MVSFVLAAACIGLCFFASIKDITTLTIPNWVNGALAVLGCLALVFSGAGLQAFAWHLGLAFVALVLGMSLFFSGFIGGGDAKMIPAVLIWLGPEGSLPFLAAMAISGGFLALILLKLRSFIPVDASGRWKLASLEIGAGAPYGVAITLGVLYAIPYTRTLSVIVS